MRVLQQWNKVSSKIGIAMLIGLFLMSFVIAMQGLSYDLSTAAYDVTGGSNILSVAVDEKHNLVYFGTSDNKFGYYNESSNSTVALSSIMSGWTTGEYYDITFDDDRNIVYVTNGGDPTKFGYYNLTSNSSVFLGNLWNYPAKIQYDDIRDVVWYASNDGDLGYLALDGTKTQKASPSSSSVSDLCLDTVDDRVYVTSYGGARIPFYYSIGNDSIIDLLQLQPNIYSCDIGYDWHYVYFSAGEDFSYSSIYRPLGGEIKVIVPSGDLNQFPDISYMQHTKTVAMTEYSNFGPDLAGRIYNISANTTSFIRDGDLDDWMTGSVMTDGDYMNGSRRYYIGFSDGKFGFYDNNFTAVPFVPLPPPSAHTQILSTDFINNSEYQLKDLPIKFRAKFVSWNYSDLSINVYLNGSNETGMTANNNTWEIFDISSIMTANTTGVYNLTVFTNFDSKTYSFTVIDDLIPVSNSSYIAIAILLIGIVFCLIYLGTNTENDILKIMLNGMSIFMLVAIAWISKLISVSLNLDPGISKMLGVIFYGMLLISSFVMFYTIYLLIVFIIMMVNEIKAGNNPFAIKKTREDDFDAFK